VAPGVVPDARGRCTRCCGGGNAVRLTLPADETLVVLSAARYVPRRQHQHPPAEYMYIHVVRALDYSREHTTADEEPLYPLAYAVADAQLSYTLEHGQGAGCWPPVEPGFVLSSTHHHIP
jgi:hypothetical protein